MQEEHLPSKFAFILHADVVGSTALVQKDEQVAHNRIQNAFSRLCNTITTYGGLTHELRGDALVAEFARASDAVSAALAFQIANTEHNKELSDDIWPELRVGIGMGEGIITNNAVTGMGVVLAQRLEQLSEPGGIVIQGAVYETIPKRLPFDFVGMGEVELKGFEEPVRAYSVALKVGEQIPSPATNKSGEISSVELSKKPSIAVLPFTNMSGDPEQEYFSDGITEDIITELSRFHSLFVISRNTTFTYKGQGINTRAVAKDLGVRYILEGSVRKARNRVRVTAQLIDGTSGSHMWADKYDRDLEDIFAVQDEITQTVVGTIQPELSRLEQDRARRKPPDWLDAWDFLQQGIWHYWRRTSDDAKRAKELISKAIACDPNFGLAYANLCEVHYIDLYHGWTDEPEETIERGLKAGQKAVSLDEQDAFAHFALGRIYTVQGEYELASSELEKALDLNPNLAIAYYALGMALYRSGRAQDALPLFHRAIQQSPRDPLLFGFEVIIGAAHLQLGEFIEAVEWCKRATRHPTSSFWTHAYLAITYANLNELEKAKAALNDTLRKQPDLSLASFEEMLHKMNPAYKKCILEGLRKAGLLG